jgi:hypothetical protein
MPPTAKISSYQEEFDYSQSRLYFLTICNADRLPLFGEIVDRAFRPAEAEGPGGGGLGFVRSGIGMTERRGIILV